MGLALNPTLALILALTLTLIPSEGQHQSDHETIVMLQCIAELNPRPDEGVYDMISPPWRGYAPYINCMQLVCLVGRLQTTLGTESDAKK